MGPRRRTIFAAIGLGVLAVATVTIALVASAPDGSHDEVPKPPANTPAVSAATPDPKPLLRAGQIERFAVAKGDRVRFRVRAASDDELHVHGYDVSRRLPAGETVNVSFVADIEGVFEIEMHGSNEQIGELTVNP